MFLQFPQLVQVVPAHAAHQKVALVEHVVHEVIEQVEILDLASAGDVDSGAGAGVDGAADGHMVFVQIGHGQILGNEIVDLFLQLLQVDVRGIIREGEDEAVLHVVVAAALHLLLGQAKFTQILGGVGHKPVGKGLVDNVVNILRLWAKDGGPGNDHFLTHADQQIGLDLQHGIDEVEVLHNYPLAAVECLGNGLGQDAHLGKACFKANIQVVGVGGKEAEAPVLLQNRQRPDVYAVVVVGQFQAGEHAPDEGAFAGASLADNADEFIEGGEVKLYQLHTQGVHAGVAPGGEISADDMTSLQVLHRVPPFTMAVFRGARRHQRRPRSGLFFIIAERREFEKVARKI